MNNIFKIDKTFVRALHQRLQTLRKHYLAHHSAPEDTPSVEQLEEMISTMIWASTQHEEGRLSRFAIAFAKPTPLDFLGLRFAVPKSLSTEELRKLAPAVVPRDGRIMVWPNASTKNLEICGLQTTGLSSVSFRVLDPGRLTVRFPLDSTIAEIAGTKAGFISADWNDNGQRMMGPKQVFSSGTLGEAISFFFIHVTEQILSRIRLLGHGGTIVFVQDEAWRNLVDQPIFYQCDQNLNEFERIIDSYKKSVSAKVGGTAQETMTEALRLIGGTEYQRFIGDAARSIAYMSAVDGATVLDSKFAVLAFGAKLKSLKRKARSTAVEMVTTVFPFEGVPASDVPIDEAFRGTRHLSAARFVLNNPKAVAFVISQDGGITGLIMDAGSSTKLLAIKSLELLL